MEKFQLAATIHLSVGVKKMENSFGKFQLSCNSGGEERENEK